MNAITQAAIDKAFTTAVKAGKTQEVAVHSRYGVGTLVLRAIPSIRGYATGSWSIRYTEGAKRPMMPLAKYDRLGQNGGIDRATALAQFDAWATRRTGNALPERAQRAPEKASPSTLELRVAALEAQVISLQAQLLELRGAVPRVRLNSL